MSVANPLQNRRIKGQLCIGPTDLSLDFPHGGTAIGGSADVIFRPDIRYRKVAAEEYGGQAVAGFMTHETCILAAFMRGIDNDAIAFLFPNTSIGPSGQIGIESPGPKRMGHRLTDRSQVLLFSPRDTESDHAILIYRAMPMVDETNATNLSINSEAGFAAVFQGIRDDSGRLYAMKRIEDLEL